MAIYGIINVYDKCLYLQTMFFLHCISFESYFELNIFFSLKQKQVKESEYGNDVQTVKAEYERHQKEHKVIDQFQVTKS